ncbi:MAG: hypothetical protein IH914_03005 [candidate division Zixibacteria bacterium]|nr:hypothetical protein [candidate division Zixibacteria bacterium]
MRGQNNSTYSPFRKSAFAAVLTGIFFCLCTSFAPGQESAMNGQAAEESISLAPLELERAGIRALLGYINLRESDFGFRNDYMPPDSFSLLQFNYLNSHPLELTEYVSSFAAAAEEGFAETIKRAVVDLRAEHGTGPVTVAEPDLTEMSGFGLYYRSSDINALLTVIYPLVNTTLPAATDSTLARLRKSQRIFLYRDLPELLLEDELAHERDVFIHDSIQQAEKETLRKFVSFGTKIRPEFILRYGTEAALEILRGVEQLMLSVERGELVLSEALFSSVEEPGRKGLRTLLGRHEGWKISGAGDDYHTGDFTVLIDIGGNDHYDLSYNPAAPHPRIIIDLAGDDIYSGKSRHTVGSGLFSLGLLIDWDGDDTYRAGNFSIGSGFCGVGIVYDRAGDDRYLGDTFTQGAGAFGLGVLFDESGRDVYQAAFNAQAFGFTKGAGLLIDRRGNDNYLAGDKYSDVLRYDNHYLSLSQGFGYGMRPFMSGGIGGLIDLEGNDTYKADIFGQGSSYWRSIGFVYDNSGNDQYLAHQYAQGSATHMALGALVDAAGDDFYRSKGVSQGCGHDYSFAVLSDRSGNDVYHAVDLSQGAGSANGVGLLCDLSGDDRYHIGNPANTNGYGNPRREFGSIGLLLDLGGVDVYDGFGADNTVWRVESKWGGGFDCIWEQWFSDSAGVNSQAGGVGR